MKKLIFFAYDLNVGGIEKALVELLKHIDYKKYEVTLVLEKKDGPLLNEIPSCIKVMEYKVSNNKIVIVRKVCNLIKRISFIFKYKNKFDYSCSYATYSIPGAVLSKIASNNSSLYVHSAYELAFKNRDDYINFFNGLGVTGFKHIIFVSNESREYFNKVFTGVKTLTCNNFINEDKIKEMSLESINLKKKAKFLFTFVGRLDESSKRITKLIKLIKYLKDCGISIELWIVGDGPDYNLYKDLVSKYKLESEITFVGMKSNPYPYIKKADYIILTSDYEGFPMVYNEAIILNTKILTTINISDDYISIPNNFGYIISKDEEKMGEEVLNILKSDCLEIKKISYKKINLEKVKLLENIFDDIM